MHVTLKLATSLDARIATSAGESRWITGEAARAEVHKMRAASDAIVIGVGTARSDDPTLTARIEPMPVRQPVRVVLDSTFSLSPASRLIATLDQAPLLVVGLESAPAERRAAVEAAGAQTAVTPATNEGVDVRAALALLTQWGVERVLVEGGGRVAASLVKAGLVDRIEWMRAPILIGEEGRPALGGMALTQLSSAPRFQRVAVRELGPDLWESYDRI